MYVSDIRLKQFRSYTDAHFSFDEKLTLITGNNGTGKTNLLEAVYVVLTGSSFRVADRELIKHDTQWWRLDSTVDDHPRQVRYQLAHTPPKQLIEHDSQVRFMYRHRLPVVLFDPTDLLLIHGSPSRRRQSLDTMLSALSQDYKTTLAKYERSLIQRNNILKKQSQNLSDALFPWDVQLSEHGMALTMARHTLVSQIGSLLDGYYTQIAAKTDAVTLTYQASHNPERDLSTYMSGLKRSLALDQIRTTTSYGPHRDDIAFSIRAHDAKHEASRGEIRTILLSLKLAYAKLLEDVYGTKPVLLFDDVFSELDADRRSNLFAHLGEYQTIVTDTHTIKNVPKTIRLAG